MKIVNSEYDLTPRDNPLLQKIYRIIYLSDSPSGVIFDKILLFLILVSSALVMLQSMPLYDSKYHLWFLNLEIGITFLFTIEYILRLVTVKDWQEYAFSMLGIIDFFSIFPFIIGLFYPELHFLSVVRTLRILRIFRIFGLDDYMQEGQSLVQALRDSTRKIFIFLLFMTIFVVIIGSLMYVVEDAANGFETIPQSIYWAVVTVTTVGYGDIAPKTDFGKFLSVIVMLAGYCVIAVPTGIISTEVRRGGKKKSMACPRCGQQEHLKDARYCQQCGEFLK